MRPLVVITHVSNCIVMTIIIIYVYIYMIYVWYMQLLVLIYATDICNWYMQLLNLRAWWRHQMETFSALLAILGIPRSPMNSPHKGQWRGALMFSLICAWRNDWVNNREAGDLRRHRAHYDVTVMWLLVQKLVFLVERKKSSWQGSSLSRAALWSTLGWGLLSQFPPFRYFPKFSPLSKYTLIVKYRVYIWQVSPQLSCGDTC